MPAKSNKAIDRIENAHRTPHMARVGRVWIVIPIARYISQ